MLMAILLKVECLVSNPLGNDNIGINTVTSVCRFLLGAKYEWLSGLLVSISSCKNHEG